jgi:mono/diheme cytochrome c family protein
MRGGFGRVLLINAMACSGGSSIPIDAIDSDPADATEELADATGSGADSGTAFTIGGTVTGLAAGTSLTLRLDGSQDLVVSSNASFTFDTPLPTGTRYRVVVDAQPYDQHCTVTGGLGVVADAPVTSITVTCGIAMGFTRVAVGPGLGNPNLANGNFAAMPLLSQTGVFTDLAMRTPHAAFAPFRVNAQLWSDGATKMRWVAVPNDGPPYDASERVAFQAAGLWAFPVGTVTLKQFDLVTDEMAGTMKRLEVRIGVRRPDGTFAGASYRWRSDGSDADLVASTTGETNTITTIAGTHEQTHTYPAPTLCPECHQPTAGFALGARTWQLNGTLAYPSGVTQNQLRAWGRAEMFTASFVDASIATYLKTVAIDDTTASLETRSRSYFEANCSSCHHPGGPNQAWDARFTTPLADQSILGGEIKAADPDGSKLYQRMSYAAVDTPTKANLMMPPLAKNHVDTYALSIVRQWILAL